MTYHNNESAPKEHLVDFTSQCRETWIGAYEYFMEGRVPPAYQDKPLSHLAVDFTKRNIYNDTGLAREHLHVVPLSLNDAAQMPIPRKTHELPGYVHDYYHAMARTIGQTALTNDTILRQAIPPGGVVGSYIASLPNEATRVVDVFRILPNQRSLHFASQMAKRALAYIMSGEADLPVEEKLMKAIAGDSKSDMLQHRFTIKMTPQLPLNGHESYQFLTSYRDKMFSLLQLRRRDLEYSMTFGAPESEIQQISNQVADYSQALKRVQDILKEH